MEYLGTLDEKCRISLPSRIRGSLKENKLILTKGDYHSIWMFTPEDWVLFVNELVNDYSGLSRNDKNHIQRRFIAPKAEIEIDKAGRIAIPPSLRDYAFLSRDIKILEVELEGVLEGVNRMEIWDSAKYSEYEKESDAQIFEAMDKMGQATPLSGKAG
jgi:MraZ protein